MNTEEPAIATGAEGTTDSVSGREIFSWAMFDFANSSYSVVIMTTIFNTYFVNEIAGGHGSDSGLATLLWTIAVTISNFLIVVSAPVLGAFADFSANKKRLLAITTTGCAVFTAALALTHHGTVALAMTLIVLANFAYGTGENLIAAFLTEIASREKMGRISAIGIALGYFGGPIMLGVCLGYIGWAQQHNQTGPQYVPVCMLLVAVAYALGTLPTFLWLRERAVASTDKTKQNFIQVGFSRLLHTLKNARQFKDLFRFLITLVVFSCGTSTVIYLAAIFAQQVIGFGPKETIVMILVVNITAAIGAFVFGHIQDKIGSVATLRITLSIWALATILAFFVSGKTEFWGVSLLIGIAMGSTQSTARALIGQFSPAGRSAEFFGLWGLAVKSASMVGPLTYGLISYLTSGNQHLAILSTAFFFFVGFLLMTTVDEKRGIEAALAAGGRSD